MVYEQIITIIIITLIIVLVWGIFKRLFKLMFYAGIIIFLLLAANTYFIYQDFKDFRENFAVSEKKVILKDGDVILTGLVLNEDTGLMADKQLNDYSSYLRNNDYESILGDSYKLMVFDVDIISKLDAEIELGDKTITSDEAIVMLKSESNPEMKAAVFSVILADEILSSRNPLFFFSGLKEGNIMIYPETALFKTIKLIPLSLIENVGKKIFEKGKEKAKSFVVEE
ncbi:MAG: hypothetical protein QF584_03295 [Candidatus Woesearchaeota archaeon]|nr:hypothetical protein [Candidatus Woesearchaeota archaeon]MDP7263343.1 hypothetical protein [Candidatus Woesearchaeota archaeon]